MVGLSKQRLEHIRDSDIPVHAKEFVQTLIDECINIACHDQNTRDLYYAFQSLIREVQHLEKGFELPIDITIFEDELKRLELQK